MSSTDIEPPAAATGWTGGAVPRAEPALFGTLVITTASQALATSSVLALATIPTLVAATLGVPSHVIGYQVSLIYAAGIVTSAMASGFVKRYGAARVGQAALFLAAGGLAALASGVLSLMLLGSGLIGVGYAFNNPASSHILNRVTPPRWRNLVYSIKQAGVPLGGILAALTVPALSAKFDWRLAILSFALATLLLAAAFFPLRASWDTDVDRSAPVVRALWSGQKAVWQDPGLAALAVIGLLYSAIQLCLSAFLVLMLIEEFSWSPVRAGAMAAAVQAFGAFGRVFWGLVAVAVKSGFAVLCFLGLVSAACLGFLPFAPRSDPFVLIFVLCVLGACSIGWNGVMLAETARLSPGRRGTLTGEVLTYTFFGVMAGPSAFSALYASTRAYTSTFSFLVAPAAVGALAALVAARSPTLRARGQND